MFEREVELYVHETAKIGAVTGATAVRFDGDDAAGRDDRETMPSDPCRPASGRRGIAC